MSYIYICCIYICTHLTRMVIKENNLVYTLYSAVYQDTLQRFPPKSVKDIELSKCPQDSRPLTF